MKLKERHITHISKYAKQHNPHEPKQGVPNPHKRHLHYQRNQVEDRRERTQRANNDSIHPLSILIFTLLTSIVEINAIQPTNRQGECELGDAQGGEEQVGECKGASFAKTHFEMFVSSTLEDVAFGCGGCLDGARRAEQGVAARSTSMMRFLTRSS